MIKLGIRGGLAEKEKQEEKIAMPHFNKFTN
jgi:hypothetical protein